MSDPLPAFLAKLERVKQHGEVWRSQCPTGTHKGHDSFIVSLGQDGQVCFYCFAGCDNDAVLSSMGLEWQDLWPGDRIRKKDTIRHSDIEQAIVHECYVLLGALGSRADNRDYKQRAATPHKTMENNGEEWEREKLAAKRLIRALKMRYDTTSSGR